MNLWVLFVFTKEIILACVIELCKRYCANPAAQYKLQVAVRYATCKFVMVAVDF